MTQIQMEKISNLLEQIRREGNFSDMIMVFREKGKDDTQLVCVPSRLPSKYMTGLFDFLLQQFRRDSKQGKEKGVHVVWTKKSSDN